MAESASFSMNWACLLAKSDSSSINWDEVDHLWPEGTVEELCGGDEQSPEGNICSLRVQERNQVEVLKMFLRDTARECESPVWGKAKDWVGGWVEHLIKRPAAVWRLRPGQQ